MNNLGDAYRNLGKCSQAEKLYRECLAKQKVVLGENDPQILLTMFGLSIVESMARRAKN